MSDFINKVITIVSKEEAKTKDGNNTTIKIKDQDGLVMVYWKKKKDGTLSSAAEQFKNMQLDEGSIVQVSYVVEPYKDAKGVDRTSNKITGFRETQEQPITGQKPVQQARPVQQPKYEPVKENATDWDKIAVGKCQTVFLQAFIQSGKTFSEAKLQVVPARQLAELVVYGTQQATPEQVSEPLPTIQQDEINVEDIPF